MTTFKRFEQGRFAASHIRFNGSMTEGLLYFDGLPRFFGFGFVKRLKVLNSRMACLR
jgi:hypothetical protein